MTGAQPPPTPAKGTDGNAPSPGASGPGEPGYEGRATVGDEGAAATPESYIDATSESETGVAPPE